jgi:hypothetical protein
MHRPYQPVSQQGEHRQPLNARRAPNGSRDDTAVGNSTPRSRENSSQPAETSGSVPSIQFADDVRRTGYIPPVPEVVQHTDTELDTNDESETASLAATSSLASGRMYNYGSSANAYRYGNRGGRTGYGMMGANGSAQYGGDDDDDDEDEDFIYRGDLNLPMDGRRQTWAQPFPTPGIGYGATDVGATPGAASISSGGYFDYGYRPGASSAYGYGGPFDHGYTSGYQRRHFNLPQSSYFRSRQAARRWLQRRSGAYDEDNHDLMQENNGIRVWYADYTTIDWIHDFVKERVRLRKLRSIKGPRGTILNALDGLQGWILMLLIGKLRN